MSDLAIPADNQSETNLTRQPDDLSLTPTTSPPDPDSSPAPALSISTAATSYVHLIDDDGYGQLSPPLITEKESIRMSDSAIGDHQNHHQVEDDVVVIDFGSLPPPSTLISTSGTNNDRQQSLTTLDTADQSSSHFAKDGDLQQQRLPLSEGSARPELNIRTDDGCLDNGGSIIACKDGHIKDPDDEGDMETPTTHRVSAAIIEAEPNQSPTVSRAAGKHPSTSTAHALTATPAPSTSPVPSTIPTTLDPNNLPAKVCMSRLDGLDQNEYLADKLKAGEEELTKISPDLRKICFRIMRDQMVGKAKTLVITGKESKVSLPEGSSDAQPIDRPTTRSAMKWSAPSLRLSFTRTASDQSRRPGHIYRGFSFEPDSSFVFRPVQDMEPSIISLILDRPALTEATELFIELLGLEGSGSLSDGYRGLLRVPGTMGSKKVIVKITCPTAFEAEDHWRFSYSKAKDRLLNEAKMYTSSLACLQKESVPIFYGLWEIRDKNASIGDWKHWRPYHVFAEVLEQVGPAITEREIYMGLSGSDKERVMDMYTTLHAEKVTHEGVKSEHIRLTPDGANLRLIDFEKSRSVSDIQACRAELHKVASVLRLTDKEFNSIMDKMGRASGKDGISP